MAPPCPSAAASTDLRFPKKTFSRQRYEIWTMQSGYHNLPAINGLDQADGLTRAARGVSSSATDGPASLTLDIAAAWPAEAGVDRWTRTVALDRGRAVTVADAWALRRVEGLCHHFITPSEGALDAGTIRLRSRPLVDGRRAGSGLIAYDRGAFHAAVETIAIADDRLLRTWGDRLFRVTLSAKHPSPAGSWTFTITPA